MTKTQEQVARKLQPALVGRASRRRVWLSCALLLVACAWFAATLVINSRAAASTAKAETKLAREADPTLMPGQDFSRFTHGEQGHARLPCLLCHRREDNSPRPRLPGHLPCAGCHTQQFANPSSPICAICHTNTQTGAVKAFPSLKSFNMRFDHARHSRTGCATCHKPAQRGVALSIPAGFGAHTNCFQCHAPGRKSAVGEDISSCSTCHQLGGYRRTPVTARAYRVNFSHAKHGGRQGLNCNSCHQVRAGMPQGRQVSAPAPAQHFGQTARAASCMACHNGKRAFGGDDFTSCQRCHQGKNFGF